MVAFDLPSGARLSFLGGVALLVARRSWFPGSLRRGVPTRHSLWTLLLVGIGGAMATLAALVASLVHFDATVNASSRRQVWLAGAAALAVGLAMAVVGNAIARKRGAR
jgi:hypothetical protein